MAFSLRHLSALAVAAVLTSGLTHAQESAIPGGFKHDSTQPIKISADSLEVRQTEQVAVFSGAVDAQQGDVRMQAEKLIVSYDPDAESDSETGAIQRVQAQGGVFISSDTGTASGNWADYNVASGSILMGDDVTLTQDKTVAAGSRLSIDLNTGTARIEGGSEPSSNGSARVQILFTPSEN